MKLKTLQPFNPAILIAILSIFGFTVSCSLETGETGIFYSLSVEQIIDDDDTRFDNISIAGLVSNNGYWLVAGGSGYAVDSDTKTADKLTVPEGMELCSAILTVNGSVFALFTDNDTADGAVYRLNGETWEAAFPDSTLPAGTVIKNIVTANDTLILSGMNTDTPWSFPVYTSDGTSLTDTGKSASFIIKDAAWDGSDYWFSGGAGLLKGSDGITALTYESELTGTTINNVHYSSTEALLYCTDDEGYVHYRDAAGVWDAYDAVTEDDTAVELFDLATVDAGGTPLLLLGTRSGIFLFDAEAAQFTALAADDDYVSDSNYSNTALSDSTVLSFVQTDGYLFALTSGEGLWYRETTLSSIWVRL